MERKHWTANDILGPLEQLYLGVLGRPQRWVFFREFRIGTGYQTTGRGGLPSVEQRIDAFTMSCWPSDGFERHSIEVKVSRGDWNKEIKYPLKRLASFRICNRFYFAVPLGLIQSDEVPLDCGLIVIDEGDARIVVKAPYHESDLPHWPFVASLARRALKAEQHTEAL